MPLLHKNIIVLKCANLCPLYCNLIKKIYTDSTSLRAQIDNTARLGDLRCFFLVVNCTYLIFFFDESVLVMWWYM